MFPTDIPGSLPVTSESAVTGTATVTAKKFESNLGRLYSRLEGETKAHAWAVGIISTVLVLPVLLTAIVDLGRVIGFTIAKKNATAAKYFDGKSFSLLDKLSAACKSLAAKTNNVFKSIITPKKLTTEELNIRSEKTMKSQVADLVSAYKALDKKAYFTGEGEERINAARKALLATANELINRNVNTAGELKGVKEAVEAKMTQLIKEASGESIFISHKTDRFGPSELLSFRILRDFAGSQMFSELPGQMMFGRATGEFSLPGKFDEHFLEMAMKETDLPATLKVGIDQKMITPEQAKAVVKEQAPILFSKGLEQGLVAASKAENTFLKQAAVLDIVTVDEAKRIRAEVKPEMDMLVIAAARDVLSKQIPEKEVEDHLAKAALKLKEQGKIDGNLEGEFASKTLELLKATKQAEVAENNERAQVQANEDLRMQEEAAAAEAVVAAEEAAIAQKVAEQAALFGTFKTLESTIEKHQAQLASLIQKRDELNAECKRIVNEEERLQGTKVWIVRNNKKEQVNLLEASNIQHAEVVRIENNGGYNDAKKAQLLNALVDNDQATIEAIEKLKELNPLYKAKAAERLAVFEQVVKKFKAVSNMIAVYEAFIRKNKNRLEPANKAEIKAGKIRIDAAQKPFNKRYDVLIDPKRPLLVGREPIRPIRDADLDDRVAEILRGDEASQSVQDQAELQAQEAAILAQEHAELEKEQVAALLQAKEEAETLSREMSEPKIEEVEEEVVEQTQPLPQEVPQVEQRPWNFFSDLYHGMGR